MSSMRHHSNSTILITAAYFLFLPMGWKLCRETENLLKDNGIECMDDRSAGSDCYGMLIARKDGNLEKAVELLDNARNR